MFPHSLSHAEHAAITDIQNAVLLQQILREDRGIPRPRNSAAYWAFFKATETARSLLETADENHRAFITITTNTKDACRAMKAISRALETQLKPHCEGYVGFFHRNQKGFVHVHVLATLKWPIMEVPFPSASDRITARQLSKMNPGPPKCQYTLTKEAKQLAKRLGNAVHRKTGLGYITKVEPVEDPENAVFYVARYLKGVVHATRRYPVDKGVRLYSISYKAAPKLYKRHFLVEGEKLVRLKLAAYAALDNCSSMCEARIKLGPKWAYNALKAGKREKLRTYPKEEDFHRDWKGLWPPEALGIRITDPNYSQNCRKFSYRYPEVGDLDRPRVDALLQNAWDLPDWAWPGEDW